MRLAPSQLTSTNAPAYQAELAHAETSSRRALQTPDICHFDRLPDAAMITVKALAAVLAQGRSTIWRKCQLEPDFPRPIRLGTGCTRFNVGAVRAYLVAKATTAAIPSRARRYKREAV